MELCSILHVVRLCVWVNLSHLYKHNKLKYERNSVLEETSCGQNQAMFTLYRILGFKPARNMGRASLLFTNKNGYLGEKGCESRA